MLGCALLLLSCQRDGAPEAERQAPVSGKRWRISVIALANEHWLQEAEAGLRAGLQQETLIAGRDYDIDVLAAADAGGLDALITRALDAGTDLFVTLSTAALQAAMRKAGDRPVVFADLGDPEAAGLSRPSVWRTWFGGCSADQRPNVTGAYAADGAESLMAVLRLCLDSPGRIGTFFVPGESDSVLYKNKLVEVAKKLGVEVDAVAVANPSELAAAAGTLVGKVTAVVLLGDTVTDRAVADVVRVAQEAKRPVFSLVAAHARAGALVALARDVHGGARRAGGMAARIIGGRRASAIAFEMVGAPRLLVNADAAGTIEMGLPLSLLRRADEVIAEEGE